MTRDTFGINYRRGAKPLSNEEWNRMVSAVDGITLGEGSGFNVSTTPTPNGINLPIDSFFQLHAAYIDPLDYTKCSIGVDREEDFYPYTDALSLPAYNLTVILNLDGGEYVFYGGQNAAVESTVVSFHTASGIAVTAPADNLDGTIVSYNWELVPEVFDVRFSDDLKTVYIDIKWVPGADFDTDTQAGLVCHDTGTATENWTPTFGESATSTDTLSGLADDWLQTNDPTNYPITITYDSDVDIYNRFIDVPVARYDFNLAQDKLERVVQLLFQYEISGGGGGISEGASNPLFEHPFKGEVYADTTIRIGADRSEAWYRFQDSITVMDTEKDENKVITFSALEDIELDTAAPFANYYVYYSCYRDTGGSWTATLEKSENWPPVSSDEPAGNIVKLLGYARYDDTDSKYIWGQEMFDCPIETVAPIIAEFEPYYELDGSVTVSAGSVRTFNNSATVAAVTYDMTADTEIWVTLTSTASTGTPSVTISALNNGSFPGKYVSVSTAQKQFNYKIGEIASGKYYPYHVGSLDIDSTMLMTDITDTYTTLTDTPRMMMFKTTQETDVGDSSNDLLIDAKILDVQVRGGSINQMNEDDEIKFYGLTYDEAGLELVSVSGVNGTAFGAGSITLTPQALDWESDRGLLQTMDFGTDSPINIEAGDNIKMEFANGTATIVGQDVTDYEALLWIAIQNNNEIVHVNSPVTSESDANHWVKLTIPSVQIDDGTAASIDLYFDVTGHLWKYDTTTQPPPNANWRYEHCSDTSTYPDLIFDAEQANDVILVDDQCYKVTTDRTQDDVTSPAPTVTDTYATCALCDAAKTNEQWKKCADDTDAAILSGTHTDVDYAWLCLSSIWVKCYADTLTVTTATDPTVLKQCAVPAPTSCTDLVGWPVSDDFGGSGCNSGSVGDTNYDIRWSTTSESGNSTISISSSQLVISARSASGSTSGAEVISNITHSGEFDIDFDIASVTGGDGSNYENYQIEVWIGASRSLIGIGNNTGGIDRQIRFFAESTIDLDSTISYSTYDLRLTRQSDNKIRAYIGGVLRGTSTNTYSGDITKIAASCGSRSTSTATVCSINSVTATDGSSNDIIIDPTGEACT